MLSITLRKDQATYFTLVRVAFLSVNAMVVTDVSKSIIHQTSIATLVAIFS